VSQDNIDRIVDRDKIGRFGGDKAQTETPERRPAVEKARKRDESRRSIQANSCQRLIE
jgi:hypothetical protein